MVHNNKNHLGLFVLHCVALLTLSIGIQSAASASPSTGCQPTRTGKPTYHHIIALDLSKTAAQILPHMQRLVACYASMFMVPGEEITLLSFGFDEHGSVKQVGTQALGTDRSTASLESTLTTLKVGKNTRTYFTPVADGIAEVLKTVPRRPVVLVFSDGRSDGLGSRGRSLPFTEIPFTSLGQVYRAPGRRARWQIAVQGADAFDLTPLFASKRATHVATQQALPHSPFAPCLIDPPLEIQADSELTLPPSAWPWETVREGVLTVQVSEPCVSRLRSFTLRVTHGEHLLASLPIIDMLVGPEPQALTVPITVPQDVQGTRALTAVVRLAPAQLLLPEQPTTITISRPTYWDVYGSSVVSFFAVFGFVVVLAMVLFIARRRRERSKPEIIEVAGASAIALSRFQGITLGGSGATMTIPGLPPGVVAHAEWRGVRGELVLRPEEDCRLKIAGVDVAHEAVYRLGTMIDVTDPKSGVNHTFTIDRGKAANVGFGSIAPMSNLPVLASTTKSTTNTDDAESFAI